MVTKDGLASQLNRLKTNICKICQFFKFESFGGGTKRNWEGTAPECPPVVTGLLQVTVAGLLPLVTVEHSHLWQVVQRESHC